MGVSMAATAAAVMKTRYEEALLAMGRELSRVKEAERLKMAEHLHDEFGQGLLVAKMRLGLLSEELPEKYAQCVNGITDIISDLIQRTRASIQNLYSTPLSQGGLKAGLQSLARQLKKTHGISCSTNLGSIPKCLTLEVQQTLYRSVRELLFNIVKHAEASRAGVLVLAKTGCVMIEVRDNGRRGFDYHEASGLDISSGGFGLLSVRADLASIGAELRVCSRSGKGTRAVISLPLDA